MADLRLCLICYYLTIRHRVHAFWGIRGMLWGLLRHLAGACTPDDYGGLDGFALVGLTVARCASL